MFSTTTIASSTTKEIANTIANSVSKLMLKPMLNMKNIDPISDRGIVTSGINIARIEPKNAKITITTIRAAYITVFATSSIDVSMNLVES